MTSQGGTESRPDDTRCVHELVQVQAAVRPTAVAVVGADAVLSYGELDRRADVLAAHLRHLGVGRAHVVGLVFRPGGAAIVAALGVLKAGAAYLPIGPDARADRTCAILTEASVRVVIGRDHPSAVPGSWEVVRLMSGGDLADSESAEREAAEETDGPRASSSVNDRACIICSRSSTGQQKRAQITHADLLDLVRGHQRAFGITPADCASQIAELTSDTAVSEIWPALAAGASVHIVDPAARANPNALRDWLVTHRITIGSAPTIIAERLMGLAWPARPDLRVLLTGPDALRRYPPVGLPFRPVRALQRFSAYTRPTPVIRRT